MEPRFKETSQEELKFNMGSNSSLPNKQISGQEKGEQERLKTDEELFERVSEHLTLLKMHSKENCLVLYSDERHIGGELNSITAIDIGIAKTEAKDHNDGSIKFVEALEEFFDCIKKTSRSLESIEIKAGRSGEGELIKHKRLDSLSHKNIGMSLEGFQIIQVLGEGAHGLVIKVQNKVGEVCVVKLYKKSIEKIFLHEVSILSLLTVDALGNFLGVSDLVETDSFYGVIMKAGAGTLGDFKDFLNAQNIRLNETELMYILSILVLEQRRLFKSGFCHRDIKPHNVILVSKELEAELIDYSLAECIKTTDNHQGYAGTLGYISPHIFEKQGDLSQEELIFGDLFSIGVTVLALAFPDYKPVQNDVKSLKRKLIELSDRKHGIQRLLNFLIFPSSYSMEDYNRLNEQMVYMRSPLSKYGKSFVKYLLSKSENGLQEPKIMSQPSPHSFNKLPGIQSLKRDLQQQWDSSKNILSERTLAAKDKDNLRKLISLNNEDCRSWNESEIEHNKCFEEAYSLIEDDMMNHAEVVMEEFLTLNLFGKIQVAFDDGKNPSTETISTIWKPEDPIVTLSLKESEKKIVQGLIFTIFFNFCISRAYCLVNLLKREGIDLLLADRILEDKQHFACALRLPGHLEILMVFRKLQKVFLDTSEKKFFEL